MICRVCGTNKRSKNIDGHKICQECGHPCVPLSSQSLERRKKAWAKVVDDRINGHKRGAWADQPDVMICFDENELITQREEAFA
jgi:hypothetical protein